MMKTINVFNSSG